MRAKSNLTSYINLVISPSSSPLKFLPFSQREVVFFLLGHGHRRGHRHQKAIPDVSDLLAVQEQRTQFSHMSRQRRRERNHVIRRQTDWRCRRLPEERQHEQSLAARSGTDAGFQRGGRLRLWWCHPRLWPEQGAEERYVYTTAADGIDQLLYLPLVWCESQVFHGVRKSISCSCWVCRRSGKEIGGGFLETSSRLGHRLRLQVTLRNISFAGAIWVAAAAGLVFLTSPRTR